MTELMHRVQAGSRRLWVLGAAGLLVALFLAFAVGRISAGSSGGVASRMLGLPDPALERANKTAQELQSRLAALEVARQVDQAASAQLAAAQDGLQAKIEEQAQELTFYRNIVSPGDSAAGLNILRVQVLAGVKPQNYRLRIMLIQAPKPAAEISGGLTIRLEGVRAGHAVSLPMVFGGSSAHSEIPYSFKAFQELSASFDVPADVKPARLQIEARTRGAPTVLRHSALWKVDAG